MSIDLNEAKEILSTLQAIEACMVRIKDIYVSRDFPCEDHLEGLSRELRGVECSMDNIIDKSEQMPAG